MSLSNKCTIAAVHEHIPKRLYRPASCREKLQELRDVVVSQQVGMQLGDFLPVVCDVTKEAEVRNLPQIISKHWPGAGIDVLVNNAGGSAGPPELMQLLSGVFV
jgi:NAD(P)-dependent dehydrogenase (short-subunit alcohol dehydrogenase family)